MPFCQVDGAEIFYEDSGGNGVPILFSHGLLWSGEMFAAQVAALRQTHRCITYDHRGQGRSPDSQTPFDMEQLAADALTLIRTLSLPPCHFVGLSMGGFVGMRLAARHPELLRSLTLIETAADREPRMNIPKYRMLAFLARLFGYRMLVPPIMKIMFAPSFLHDPNRQEQRRQMEHHLAKLRDAATRAALESVISRQPIEHELSRIRIPTLVLHGTDDAAIVPHRAQKMAAAILGSKLVMVPHAGHTSTVEEPAAINAALCAFVQSLSDSQPA